MSEEATGPTQRELSEVANARLRDAAKWLIGAFAAVGAALIAGSQLSNIGKLHGCFALSLQCNRLWVAIAGAVVGLIGVVLAIWTGVEILTRDALPPDDLQKEWCKHDKSAVYRFFQHNRSYLQGFKDFDDVSAQEAALYSKFDQLSIQFDAATNQGEKQRIASEMKGVRSELNNLLAKSEAVVALANEVAFGSIFRSKAKKGILFAAGLAALGIGIFAWAANPPPPSPSVSAALRGASLRNANLKGVNLRGADLSDSDLTGANLTGADLTDARMNNVQLDRVIWSHTTCPDGVNSDDAAQSCVNHLKIR